MIWVPPESAPPTRLLTGLSRRHVPVTVLSDAPSVMLDLSLPFEPLALIVVEPEQQPHVDQLLAAVRRYYKRVPLWQYRANPAAAGGGLRRQAGDDAETGPTLSTETTDSHNVEGVDTSNAHHERPALADAATSAEADDHLEADDEEASDRRALRLLADEPRGPLLTAEELEMLLGPTHPEEPPRT